MYVWVCVPLCVCSCVCVRSALIHAQLGGLVKCADDACSTWFHALCGKRAGFIIDVKARVRRDGDAVSVGRLPLHGSCASTGKATAASCSIIK